MAIGRVLDYLDQHSLMENTAIMFSSGNGSYHLESDACLKAVKSYLYDGVIRVPGIIKWSGIKTTKKIIEDPVGLIDVMPTLCEIIGVDPSNDLDVTSFMPI